MYQHLNIQGQPVPLPVTRALCIGRNYLEHIQELNNTVPDEALLFMKPAPALCHLSEPVVIPSYKGECHNELEVAILLSQSLCKATCRCSSDFPALLRLLCCPGHAWPTVPERLVVLYRYMVTGRINADGNLHRRPHR